MSNHNNIQRRLSRAVSSWLLYEFSCERGYLCNEKYISIPIGNLLNTISDYQLLTEVNHPCSNKNIKGRPLQVDFVILDYYNPVKKDWKIALESKWIGNTSISQESVLWDLVRLQNLFRFNQDIRCFFLIAGLGKGVRKFLNKFDVLTTNKKERGKFISVNNNLLTFHLNELDNNSSTIRKSISDKLTKNPSFRLYSKIHQQFPM